jgi:serine/threonine protein kinase
VTTDSESSPSNAPETLARGRYQLRQVIGEGGIASVWSAVDRTLGVERAIKLLDEQAGRYPAFRSRFHTEARIMARIEHPTVMRVYDYGSEAGRYYLVMELIEGGSVKDLLVAGKRIPPARALRIAFDVVSALTAVHAMGAIHRDVKPGNILLATDGSARLSDFGIVRLVDSQPLHETRSDDRLGTVGYMAPEQSVDPTNVGPPADLYAVGATLFAMVTGRHPSVLAALQRRPELLGKVHPAVAGVIISATEWEVEDRYRDGRTMAQGLADAINAVTGEPLGQSWMAKLDVSLENCLARRGRKPPGPTPPILSMRSLSPTASPILDERTQPGRQRTPEPATLPGDTDGRTQPVTVSTGALFGAFALGIVVMGASALALWIFFG